MSATDLVLATTSSEQFGPSSQPASSITSDAQISEATSSSDASLSLQATSSLEAMSSPETTSTPDAMSNSEFVPGADSASSLFMMYVSEDLSSLAMTSSSASTSSPSDIVSMSEPIASEFDSSRPETYYQSDPTAGLISSLDPESSSSNAGELSSTLPSITSSGTTPSMSDDAPTTEWLSSSLEAENISASATSARFPVSDISVYDATSCLESESAMRFESEQASGVPDASLTTLLYSSNFFSPDSYLPSLSAASSLIEPNPVPVTTAESASPIEAMAPSDASSLLSHSESSDHLPDLGPSSVVDTASEFASSSDLTLSLDAVSSYSEMPSVIPLSVTESSSSSSSSIVVFSSATSELLPSTMAPDTWPGLSTAPSLALQSTFFDDSPTNTAVSQMLTPSSVASFSTFENPTPLDITSSSSLGSLTALVSELEVSSSSSFGVLDSWPTAMSLHTSSEFSVLNAYPTSGS
ncbi:hypothetical protein LTS18_000137 [Coniosporium uncinatum]|uniref:Uncharacterized protein n=1 Tax=Coniosporium uncinatum TaxID=93489 RepID=A0ACC3DUZ7_9PEZI|nr:hypothetical protein LTS18_000137 [Coniosporium uncinatum]